MLLGPEFFNAQEPNIGSDIANPGLIADMLRKIPQTAQFEAPPQMAQNEMPQNASPVSAPVAPAGPVPETSLFGRLSRGINDNSSMLMALGAGIAGGRTIGEGLSRGFSGAAQASMLDDKNKQARLGQTATYNVLLSRGLPQDVALAASANPEIMKTILPTLFGPKDAPKTIEVQGRTLQWDPKTQGWSAVTLPNAAQNQYNMDPTKYDGIRKEYQSLPAIKNWDNAVSVYSSMTKSAPMATSASDIDLVYGLAKMLDPDSVVREGEFATVQKSSSIPEQIKGQLQYLLEGKGKLTPEQRQQIMDIAHNRLSSYHEEANSAGERFGGIAKNFNLDPSMIVRKIDAPKKWQKAEEQTGPMGPGNYIYDPKAKKLVR